MCGGEESTALRQNPASREGKFDCAINIVLHRGKICAFRSFLYGEGIMVAARVQSASAEVLPDSRGGVYVTSAARDDLAGAPCQGRLQAVAVKLRDTRLSEMEICRLSGMP
jgi:class 3 adenylate cyclase